MYANIVPLYKIGECAYIMPQRIKSHTIETNTTDNVRKIINSENCLFRELTGRDYGIDAIIECFNKGEITGKIAFLQLKGTSAEIVPLKNNLEISCSISTSNAIYACQKNIPVLLIFSSIKSDNTFYYVFLQNIQFNEQLLKKQKSITVHIPVANIISDNMEDLVKLINNFYKN